MSKTSRNDTVWYPTVFMIILALVMTLILAFLEYGTKDRIQMLQNEDFNKKLLYAMNIPFEPSDVDSIVANHIEVRPIDFVDSPESFFPKQLLCISRWLGCACGRFSDQRQSALGYGRCDRRNG